MNKKEVAERIRTLRENKKLTQNALAYQAGISPTYIHQLERGEKSPTIEYLNHICWGLGITLQEFFAVEKVSASVNKYTALNENQKELLKNFLDSLN